MPLLSTLKSGFIKSLACLTTSIKIGESVYTHQEGVIDLTIYNENLKKYVDDKIQQAGGTDVVEKKELVFNSFYEFPATGESDCLYIATDRKIIYF